METGDEFQNKQRDMTAPMDNEDNDGSENVAKKWICVLSNFIAFFWTRLICQM